MSNADPMTASRLPGLVDLEIARIGSDPDQPRTRFDEEELTRLADTIRTCSILQPIVVTPGTGRPGAAEFRVLFGERRLRAAKLAGRSHVPAIVRTDPLSADERIVLQLTENDQRAPLSLLERASALKRALAASGLSATEFAQRHHLGKPYLSKQLWLAGATGLLAEALNEGLLNRLENARLFSRLEVDSQRHLLASARKSGEPITVARIERTATAADPFDYSVEATEPVEDPPAIGATDLRRAGDSPQAPSPRFTLEIPLPALLRLLKRLGLEPAPTPDGALAQLRELIERDVD